MIVRSAVRLCDGLHGFVGRFDGELIHFAAQYNYTPEALQMVQRMYPRPPDRQQAAGRAILTGDVVNIADVQADSEYATDLAVAGAGGAFSTCRCCARASRSARSASPGAGRAVPGRPGRPAEDVRRPVP